MTSLPIVRPRRRQATLRIALVALLPLVALFGCDSNDVLGADTQLDAAMAQATPQPVMLMSDPTQNVGTSKVVRTKNGFSFRIQTSGLTPGDVVTAWTFIFNNPEFCDGPCDLPDVFNPDVQADAIYADGRVVGGSGTATYAGHTSVGDNGGTIFPDFLGLPSPGLLDSEKAEIHFVLHSHGPKIPGLTNEMLKSFNAGCGPEFMGMPVPESLGTHGPNTCEDVQFAVHPSAP